MTLFCGPHSVTISGKHCIEKPYRVRVHPALDGPTVQYSHIEQLVGEVHCICFLNMAIFKANMPMIMPMPRMNSCFARTFRKEGLTLKTPETRFSPLTLNLTLCTPVAVAVILNEGSRQEPYDYQSLSLRYLNSFFHFLSTESSALLEYYKIFSCILGSHQHLQLMGT